MTSIATKTTLTIKNITHLRIRVSLSVCEGRQAGGDPPVPKKVGLFSPPQFYLKNVDFVFFMHLAQNAPQKSTLNEKP